MKNKGFTLIELLVGVALVGFVTLAGYTFYLNTFQFQVMQERQKDMKISLQLAMDLLVSDIRAAGFGVTDPRNSGANRSGIGCSGVLRASVVVANCLGGNKSVIVQNNIVATSTDGVATTTDQMATSTDGIVLIERDLFIGTVSADIVAGGSVITIGPPVVGTVAVGDLITIGGLFSSIVTAVSTTTGTATITLNNALGRRYTDALGIQDTYPAGLDVYTVVRITYAIALSKGKPALFRKVGAAAPVQLADGIEDLQVAYYLHPKGESFADLNNNGVCDPPGETFIDLNGNGICDPDPIGTVPAAVSSPGVGASFRAVRVSLSARIPDTNNDFKGGYRSTLEDHAGMATTTPGDNFRRIVLTRVVELFNDGME